MTVEAWERYEDRNIRAQLSYRREPAVRWCGAAWLMEVEDCYSEGGRDDLCNGHRALYQRSYVKNLRNTQRCDVCGIHNTKEGACWWCQDGGTT